jgi:hypothetical protein
MGDRNPFSFSRTSGVLEVRAPIVLSSTCGGVECAKADKSPYVSPSSGMSGASKGSGTILTERLMLFPKGRCGRVTGSRRSHLRYRGISLLSGDGCVS